MIVSKRADIDKSPRCVHIYIYIYIYIYESSLTYPLPFFLSLRVKFHRSDCSQRFPIWFGIHLFSGGRGGVMVKVMDHRIVVSKFVH